MAKEKFYVRRSDTGAGVIFNSEKEAKDFVKSHPEYAAETDDERAANQAAADEEVKARAKAEDKAVKPAANKAQG